jgi:hypothetical protein
VGQYEDARAEAHDALRGVARRQETITYGKLVAAFHAAELHRVHDAHGRA